MPSPIKSALIIFILTVFFTAPVIAESKYISEDFEITMRTGPGTDRKIIALIPSGRQVEVIVKGEEWSEVALPNGKQGFVLTRYLTDQLPTPLQLERLQQKHTLLQAKNEELQSKSNELTAENKELKDALANTRHELAGLTTTHEALRKGAGEYLSLKEKFDKTVKDLDEVSAKADSYESEVHKLANKEFTDGMLYGGGILVFGIVLGLIFRKPKRKSSLL